MVNPAVREYRRAVRLIIAAPKSRHDRLVALMRLADRARRSKAGLPVERAIWLEAKAFVRRERQQSDELQEARR